MNALADLPVPSAVPAPEAPAPAPEATIPSPFADVIAGTIPGVQLPPISREAGAPDPVQGYVIENFPELLAAGLEYTDVPGDVTVLYNPSNLTEAQIQSAAKDGTLDSLVPPATAPAAPAAEAGLAGVAVPPPVPPQTAGPAPGPAGATPPGVMRQRLANVTPPSPIKPNPIPDQLAKRAL